MKIRANNLVFKNIGKVVVDGASFVCMGNEQTAIVGPEGSGKRALLLMIGGFLKPSSGTVQIDRHDISDDLRGYRKIVSLGEMDGINPLILEQSPRENLRFALDMAGRRYTKESLQEIIGSFYIDTFADTPIEECSQLVRALTSLSCCLAVEPEIMILDEPTKRLSSEYRARYWEILDEKIGKKTLIFSTKDSTEAESRTDHIITLEDGRVTRGGEKS